MCRVHPQLTDGAAPVALGNLPARDVLLTLLVATFYVSCQTELNGT